MVSALPQRRECHGGRGAGQGGGARTAGDPRRLAPGHVAKCETSPGGGLVVRHSSNFGWDGSPEPSHPKTTERCANRVKLFQCRITEWTASTLSLLTLWSGGGCERWTSNSRAGISVTSRKLWMSPRSPLAVGSRV